MLLKLRQERRNLLGRQPAERSSKSSEEDDDTGLILPQLLECCDLLGGRVCQLTVCNLVRIHGEWRSFSENINTLIRFNEYDYHCEIMDG